MVEPAQLHHRRDEGPRDGRALRRLAAQVRGARTDAFFDAAGTDLLAGLLLAAAVAKRPITQVYSWLADQRNDEPERILRNTPGLQLSADALSGVINAPDKQRAGVYGTAQQSAQFLVNRKVTRWVIPQGPNDNRPQFNPHQFVREGGTLYSLSKEGAGTAGPLVTALTVAVVEAAEEYAKTCPMGRMPSPLVGVLDEAANVCRWKDLPDLYSHFGSRGIVLMTILQSWAQGDGVLGRARHGEALVRREHPRVRRWRLGRELPRAAEQADRRLRHHVQLGLLQQGRARHQPADPAAPHHGGLRPRLDAARAGGRVPVRYPGDDDQDGAVDGPAGRRRGEGVACAVRSWSIRCASPAGGANPGSRPAAAAGACSAAPDRRQPVWEQNEEQRRGW